MKWVENGIKLLQGFKVLTLEEKSGKVELETYTLQACAFHAEMKTTEQYFTSKFSKVFNQISHCILQDYLKSFHLKYFTCSFKWTKLFSREQRSIWDCNFLDNASFKTYLRDFLYKLHVFYVQRNYIQTDTACYYNIFPKILANCYCQWA